MKQKINRALTIAAMVLSFFLILALTKFIPSMVLSVFADHDVSQTDAVSPSEPNDPVIPYVNRINVLENPMKPMARGILTHVTSSGASITVAKLFEMTSPASTAIPGSLTRTREQVAAASSRPRVPLIRSRP